MVSTYKRSLASVKQQVVKLQPLIDDGAFLDVIFRIEGIIRAVLSYQINGDCVAVPDGKVLIWIDQNGDRMLRI